MSGAGHQQLKAWEAEPIYLKVSMLSPICPKKYFVLWVIFKYASKWVGLAAHHWATANGMGWGQHQWISIFSILTPIYPIKCYCSLSCNENMPLHGWGLDDPLLGNSSWRQGGWAWAPPTNLKFSMLIHISLFLCSWNSQTAIILYKAILSLSLYSLVLGTVKPLSCYAKTFSLPLSLSLHLFLEQSNSYYVIQRHSLSLYSLFFEQSNHYYFIQRHSLSLSLFPCSGTVKPLFCFSKTFSLSLSSPVLRTVKPLLCYSYILSLSLSILLFLERSCR